MRDKISGDWVSHLFVLNETKMFYAKFQCTKNGPEQEEEEEDDDEEQNYVYQQIPEDVAEHELHYSEIWFHGHLNGGKNKSKELLEEYGPKLGDGTFLVRNSDSLIGFYHFILVIYLIMSFFFISHFTHDAVIALGIKKKSATPVSKVELSTVQVGNGRKISS